MTDILTDNQETSGPTENGTDNREEEDAPLVASERETYFQALRLWINQVQVYQNLSTCFPYYMMSFRGRQPPMITPIMNNNYQMQGPQIPFQIPNIRLGRQNPGSPHPPADVIASNGGYEYVIPQIHKRLMAEFIDFLLLFALKLAITYMAVDMLEVIDLDKFDFYKFSENYDDYQFALELTSDILFLETVYRTMVCIFEAICLWGNPGRSGGATPGKAILGLRVVSATSIIPVEGRQRETVLLYPGRPLTFFKALSRSLIKNFFISLLFPLCVVLFVFKYNRTGYDLLCGVIVVEENMFPPRRHAP